MKRNEWHHCPDDGTALIPRGTGLYCPRCKRDRAADAVIADLKLPRRLRAQPAHSYAPAEHLELPPNGRALPSKSTESK